MLVKDKCWKHLGTKLTLRYSIIHVVEHYDFVFIIPITIINFFLYLNIIKRSLLFLKTYTVSLVFTC